MNFYNVYFRKCMLVLHSIFVVGMQLFSYSVCCNVLKANVWTLPWSVRSERPGKTIPAIGYVDA